MYGFYTYPGLMVSSHNITSSTIPEFRVTGILAADGQMTLTCGGRIAAIDVAQPWPETFTF